MIGRPPRSCPMEVPQATLGGLTPQAALQVMWNNLPAQVNRLERLSWTILGGITAIGGVWGWKLFVAPHTTAVVAVAAKAVGLS